MLEAAKMTLQQVEKVLAQDPSNGAAISFGVSALGALGEKDPVVPGADRAGDDLGVLVVDELAARADQPLAVVALGHALLEMVGRVPRQARAVGNDG